MFVLWNQPFRPFVVIASGMICGLLFADQQGINSLIFLLLTLVTVMCGGLIFYYYAHGLKISIFICTLTITGAWFSWIDDNNQSQWSPKWDNQSIYLRGEIASQPLIEGDRLTFDWQIANQYNGRHWNKTIPEVIKVRIRLSHLEERGIAEKLLRHQSIQAKVRLRLPPKKTNPGGFDYTVYLKHRFIHWQGDIDHLRSIFTYKAPEFDIWTTMDRLRNVCMQHIDQLFPPEHAGLVKSMITGDRRDLTPQIEDIYTVSGMVHILSISGMQVSMLVGFCYLLCIRLRMTREKAALLILFSLPLYVLFTGAEAPVVRAALMAGCALMAVILNRWQEAGSFFALALIVQLLWNPYQLWEAGFQLSYLMTLVLMVVSSTWFTENATIRWRIHYIWVIAVAAQLASIPILIVFFYQSSWFSWLSNVLFVPVLTFLLHPVATCALLLSLLWPTAGLQLAQLISLCLDGIHQVVLKLKPLFLWQASWAPPSIYWIVLYAVSLLLAWFIFSSRHVRITVVHRWGIMLWIIGLLFYAHQFPSGQTPETRLTFLDVGQGDCLVIETREGRVILVDGGGIPVFNQHQWQKKQKSFDVGADVLVPYLRYRGIQKVDDMILTHGDFDHFAGLRAVSENFPVGRVIRNAYLAHSLQEKKLMHIWKQRNIPVYQAYQGTEESLESGITWEFIHPQKRLDLQAEHSLNRDSLVNVLSIYGWRVMLTGDIDEQAEQQIVKTTHPQMVDVLKVAHHGSSTSSSAQWLQHFRPKHAVISAGRNNRFGHPTPEVIHRLQKSGSRIWRTDQQGAITFTFSPQGYQVETVLKP